MDKITINKELCKSCGYCVEFCPRGVLKIGHESNLKGYQYVVEADKEACVGCGICATMCPDAAISLYR